MPSPKQFKKDLKRSQPLVDASCYWFQRRGFNTNQTKGKAPYDFRATKVKDKTLTEFQVECKFDQRSAETGNICLELSSIKYSTADIFIIGTLESAYLLTIAQAVHLYAHAEDKRPVGDIPNNWCALIPKTQLDSLKIPKINELSKMRTRVHS